MFCVNKSRYNNTLTELNQEIFFLKEALNIAKRDIINKKQIIDEYANLNYLNTNTNVFNNIINDKIKINSFEQENLDILNYIKNLEYHSKYNEKDKNIIINKILKLETENNKLKNINNSLSKYTCIICFENEKNILLQPCNHLCYCNNCFNKYNLKLTNCPVCRSNINNTSKIYI